MHAEAPSPSAAAIRWPHALLATIVGLFALLGAAEAGPGPLVAPQYVLLGLSAVVLLLIRRAPVTTFVLALALHLTYVLSGYPEAYEYLPTTVALGGLARAHGWRVTVPLAVVMTVMASFEGVATTGVASLDAETLLTILGLGTAIVVGEWLRTRQAWVDAVRDRALLAERTREQAAQRRADEERLRIAREVHDVVAHAIASINVQAGVGEHVADRDPAQAAASLGAIRRASSQALDELRAVLGTLRDDTAAPAGRTRARLDEVDGLAARAREAGLRAEVRTVGTRRPLPEEVEQAAYRILQEAVTNAVRHAGEATVTLQVAYGRDVVEVEVCDDGAGSAGSTGSADGHGLRGIRERAAALGGAVEAGPGPDGGFRVWARLPAPEVRT